MKYPTNKTVLITGASSGIGLALAKEFAKNNYNIIAVAQHHDSLVQIKNDISRNHTIHVDTIAMDLSKDDAANQLYQEVQNRSYTIDVLVNDAGIGQRDYFVEGDWEKYSRMIHLNNLTLTHLTYLFAKDMVARNEGKILQLGSVAGFQPGPFMAVYHATKAFVVSFSEALATEFEEMESDVTITCLCPGATDTEFFVKAEMINTKVYQNKEKTMMQPEDVAKGAYKALMDGERIYIPGAMNKVMTFIRRAIPKSLQAKMQQQFYETSEE
ncbi:MAG: SDR family NAD(P)-dependent oxidoreductase [Aquaticitalea sp.]